MGGESTLRDETIFIASKDIEGVIASALLARYHDEAYKEIGGKIGIIFINSSNELEGLEKSLSESRYIYVINIGLKPNPVTVLSFAERLGRRFCYWYDNHGGWPQGIIDNSSRFSVYPGQSCAEQIPLADSIIGGKDFEPSSKQLVQDAISIKRNAKDFEISSESRLVRAAIHSDPKSNEVYENAFRYLSDVGVNKQDLVLKLAKHVVNRF